MEGGTAVTCTGSGDCTASPHIHGCYADRDGDCERPFEHEPFGVSCSLAWRPYCGCWRTRLLDGFEVSS
jgi:hypothetical protein